MRLLAHIEKTRERHEESGFFDNMLEDSKRTPTVEIRFETAGTGALLEPFQFYWH